FAVTVAVAVAMSAVVSLTLTPVMCARFLHPPAPIAERSRVDRIAEAFLAAMLRRYDRGLQWVLVHQPLTLAVTIGLAVLTVWLYYAIPKGLFPEQDTGFVFGEAQGREDISYAAMVERQNQLTAVLLQDPAVESVVSFAGATAFIPSENLARLFIQLKP